MDRQTFLRKALNTFITPTKTVFNVPVGEAKEILENFVGIYIPRDELIDLMTAEGFVFREAGVNLGRTNFEKWDSLCDAIVVLKHIFANSHGRHNEDVDAVVRDILVRRVNADTDPAPVGTENPN
jgi:hypothetical protein